LGSPAELMLGGSICESIDFYSQSGAYPRLGQPQHGAALRQPAVSMRRAMLNEAIVDKAWSSCVEVHFEKRLVRIEDRPDRPIVAHFTDGTSAEGDFLIGADGVHSTVRGHVVPDGPTPCDTGLLSFGGFVPRSLLESGRRRAEPRNDLRSERLLRLRPLCARGRQWRDVLEHPAGHGTDATTFRAMDQATLRQHLRHFHAGWHDPIPQLIDALEEIVVTATLDVATLPTWSRGRTLLIGDAAHATSPHAGQGASIALEDAYRLVRTLSGRRRDRHCLPEFRTRAPAPRERLVALARRNGSQKREFSRTGAWIRDHMIKLTLPLTARSQDWIYGYDVRDVRTPPQTSGRHDRLAA